jgi:hypothetical protein
LCGAPLIFARSENGVVVPLDRKAPVYRVTREGTGQFRAVRDVTSLVSHFCTCPKANEVKRPGQQQRQAPPTQASPGQRPAGKGPPKEYGRRYRR